MAVTFNDLVSQNKRNSVLLVVLVSLFLIALGGLFGYAIGYNQMGADWQGPTASGMMIALVVAVITFLFSYYGGSRTILAISGARPMKKEDDPQLYNVVEEMAIAAGLPMPAVYLIDDTAPNAFATGRDPAHAAVAVTTGLRQKLTRDELQGVIAHEMSHVRNYDIRFSMLIAVMVGTIALLCDFFLRSMWFGSRRSGRSRSDRGGSGGGGGAALLMVVALLLAILAPIIAKLIELAVSRQREYLADASGVELTRNPDGLASALAKISDDPEVLEAANRATQHLYIVNPVKSFEERAAMLFSTHPPVKDRINRIRSLKL